MLETFRRIGVDEDTRRPLPDHEVFGGLVYEARQ